MLHAASLPPSRPSSRQVDASQSLLQRRLVLQATVLRPTALVSQKPSWTWLGLPMDTPEDSSTAATMCSAAQGLDERTRAVRTAREAQQLASAAERDRLARQAAQGHYKGVYPQATGEAGREDSGGHATSNGVMGTGEKSNRDVGPPHRPAAEQEGSSGEGSRPEGRQLGLMEQVQVEWPGTATWTRLMHSLQWTQHLLAHGVTVLKAPFVDALSPEGGEVGQDSAAVRQRVLSRSAEAVTAHFDALDVEREGQLSTHVDSGSSRSGEGPVAGSARTAREFIARKQAAAAQRAREAASVPTAAGGASGGAVAGAGGSSSGGVSSRNAGSGGTGNSSMKARDPRRTSQQPSMAVSLGARNGGEGQGTAGGRSAGGGGAGGAVGSLDVKGQVKKVPEHATLDEGVAKAGGKPRGKGLAGLLAPVLQSVRVRDGTMLLVGYADFEPR